MEVIIKLFLMSCLIISFITTPMFSKKDICFGVRISSLNASQLKKIRKKYILLNLLLGVVATYIMLKVQEPIWGMMGTVFGYMIAYTIIYLMAYEEVKVLKNEQITNVRLSHVTVVDTKFTKEREKNMRVSPWYFVIPLSIIIVTLVITALYYDYIPDPIPMHYNASGEVDKWAKKTYGSVFMLQLVSGAMTVVFYYIYIIIGKSKQQISTKQPRLSSEQNRLYRKIWSIYVIASATLMNLLFSYIQLSLFRNPVEKSTQMMYVTLGFTLVMIISTLAIGLFAGNGGSKLKVSYQDDNEWQEEEIDDDKYWKWGMIYYNPNDPTVFVEKRVGIGWTLNMATIQGKIYTIGLLVFIIVIITMSIIIK